MDNLILSQNSILGKEDYSFHSRLCLDYSESKVQNVKVFISLDSKDPVSYNTW